jgi:hypothetical protein
MTSLRTGFGLVVATIALAVTSAVAAAAEEPLVPPGNSAVNQYTETFPTAGGDKDFEKGKRSPGKTLGDGNARRLEQQGPDGRAAAEVAAETAPAGEAQPPPAAGVDSEADAGGAGATGGGGGAVGGGQAGAAKPVPVEAADVNGSSGFGEVLAQATGSSDSGEMGLWLPLLILVALACSVAYLLRRTRRAQP